MAWRFKESLDHPVERELVKAPFMEQKIDSRLWNKGYHLVSHPEKKNMLSPCLKVGESIFSLVSYINRKVKRFQGRHFLDGHQYAFANMVVIVAHFKRDFLGADDNSCQ